jgi:squalene-hopene/tetraprenyl-beta-curcumene cyclase
MRKADFHMQQKVMKTSVVAAAVFCGLCVGSNAQPATSSVPTNAPTRPEVRAAIERGLAFLQKAQNSNGWWSTPDQPAVTALVLTAMNLEPTHRFRRNRTSEMNRGFDYLLSCVKPDGSIQKAGLANYNTSLSLMALTSAADTNFLPVILKAREFIASTQIDLGVKGTNDTPFDGGVGYGSKYDHSDMNNTLTAIEAMRFSEAFFPKDVPAFAAQTPDLDWKAVAHFLQNCQNLPGTNTADWVSSDPKDRGGFVYYPGHSMAGGVTNSRTGKVALRSYGSMSYGGLLSYIYAKLGKEDPRVVAVKDWLRSNYTLEENPGMEQQGYFYYLHLLTKALTAAEEDRLKLANGAEVLWGDQVAARLLKLQKSNGRARHVLRRDDPGNAGVEDALILNHQEHRKKPAGFVRLWAALTMPCVALCAAEPAPEALSTNQPGSAGDATNAALQAALRKLKFPGVTINVQERCVDVESAVCLHRGALELVACAKGTKEHESIVAVAAKPMHIHAALLLLGAKPGNPATRQQLGDQAGRWIDVPPSGGPVDVFLVLKSGEGEIVEHPISDFIAPSDKRSNDSAAADQEARFPTHTFLFAGSVLYGDGPGPRRYLSDESGNVISLSTFGDELLCLPAIHSQDNDALRWQVNATNLPPVGSNVTLRLRPRIPPAAKAGKSGPASAISVPKQPQQ